MEDKVCWFSAIPLELHLEIFRFLSPKDVLLSISSVNKQWHSLCKEDSLWREFYVARFNDPVALDHKVVSAISWKDTFKILATMAWGEHHDDLKVEGMHCQSSEPVGPWKSVVAAKPFESGVHYWEIKVHYCTNSPFIICVNIGILGENTGIAPTWDISKEMNCLGWVAYRNFPGQRDNPSPRVIYGQGDTVGVLIREKSEHTWTVTYFKNGVYIGCPFILPGVSKIYPAVSLDAGAKIELVPRAFPPEYAEPEEKDPPQEIAKLSSYSWYWWGAPS